MIIHVTDCFHPRLGGIETQVDQLVRAQQAHGETVHVITATPSDHATERSDNGYPVHRVVTSLPSNLPVHPRAGAHLHRLFRDLQPSTVHVHLGAVSPFGWSAVRCALRCGLPTVVTVHSMWRRASQGMYRFFDRTMGWGTAPVVVTAVSSACADLIRLTNPSVAVSAISNGIATQTWNRRVNPDDDRADGEVHIVAVGRLAPRKRPLGLLKVLNAARRRIDPNVPLRATIAGDGPALHAMRWYLHAHGMTDWVRLPGRLDREGVRRLLATADLFVNPTVHESFGIATLEARTAGVPVIARAGNGVADFIRHGQEGLLAHSTRELIEALAWLAQDSDTRQRIRTHNRATEPVHCTWPLVVRAFRRCYDQAAALAATPRAAAATSQRTGDHA